MIGTFHPDNFLHKLLGVIIIDTHGKFVMNSIWKPKLYVTVNMILLFLFSKTYRLLHFSGMDEAPVFFTPFFRFFPLEENSANFLQSKRTCRSALVNSAPEDFCFADKASNTRGYLAWLLFTFVTSDTNYEL